MNHFVKYLFASLCICTIFSCEKKNIDKNEPTDVRLNNYMEEKMKDVYYWADEIRDRKPDNNLSPEKFLTEMIYTPEDRWTHLEEDPEVVTKSAEPDVYETGMGYKLLFSKLNDGNYIAGIGYVYPNTPAAEAGLKRGDIICTNNDKRMSWEQATRLLTTSEVNIQLGDFNNSGSIIIRDEKIHLTSRQFEITPILVDTVFEIEDKKVGYLFYTAFDGNRTSSLTDLNDAIAKQKAAEIDEFILDLRYNPGGYDFLVQRLSSLLAPATEVSKQSVLIHEKFNTRYKANDLRFDASVLSQNLDRQKIYVITSRSTASASEVLISGLKPYMQEVIVIGEQTVGKYVGGSTFIPKDEDLKKWNLSLITFSYTNKNGESVKGGISPKVPHEEYINTLYKLGDPREPLLARTLEEIFGTRSITVKSVGRHLPLISDETPYEKAQQRFIKVLENCNP